MPVFASLPRHTCNDTPGRNAWRLPGLSTSTERTRSATIQRPETAPNGRPASQPAGDRTLARLYMTSDLRAVTGLSRTHLDFYLREGLVIPTARTESGYLLFDDREADLLREIVAERQAGTPLRDSRRRIGR